LSVWAPLIAHLLRQNGTDEAPGRFSEEKMMMNHLDSRRVLRLSAWCCRTVVVVPSHADGHGVSGRRRGLGRHGDRPLREAMKLAVLLYFNACR
jgi:hypothetical protein